MAFGTPSNLSLGLLGKIAGGNANTTSEAKLGAICRGSTGTQTSMWADFKAGSLTIASVNNDGSGGNSLKWKITVQGDVATYMGGATTITSGTEGKVNANTGDYAINLVESGQGSLYQSRIQNRSTNSSSYAASHEDVIGTSSWSFQQQYTEQDKFRALAV